MPVRRSTASVPSPPPAGVRAAALALLARREYTRHELERKLLDKGYAADDVRAALDGLTADGAVDDRRAAAAHVRTASRIKGRGRLRIRRELEARGVDRALARELVDSLTDADEVAAVRRAVGRRPTTGLSRLERERQYRKLLRRGFGADAIQAVIGRGSGGDQPDE